MTKRILTTIMAAAIALTSLSAAPVQAGDRDKLARFIVGAGALAIIANEVSKNKGRDKVVVTRHNSWEKPRHHNNWHKPHHNTWSKPKYNNNHYKPKPRRKVVPAACLRINKSGYGPKRYFGQRCLQKNMHKAHRLPGYCTAKIWTKHGKRYVYGARCLRKNGWVFG